MQKPGERLGNQEQEKLRTRVFRWWHNLSCLCWTILKLKTKRKVDPVYGVQNVGPWRVYFWWQQKVLCLSKLFIRWFKFWLTQSLQIVLSWFIELSRWFLFWFQLWMLNPILFLLKTMPLYKWSQCSLLCILVVSVILQDIYMYIINVLEAILRSVYMVDILYCSLLCCNLY